MPRVKRGTHRRASRKKTLELASGYFLTKSKLYRAAQEAVERGLKFAYVGRKNKKREYRSLWIVRINASCRAAGISYSQFLHGLKTAGLDLNRKILAEMAVDNEAEFRTLVATCRRTICRSSRSCSPGAGSGRKVSTPAPSRSPERAC